MWKLMFASNSIFMATEQTVLQNEPLWPPTNPSDSCRSSALSLGPGCSPRVASPSPLCPKLAILPSAAMAVAISSHAALLEENTFNTVLLSHKPYLTYYRRQSRHNACFSLVLPFSEFRKARFLDALLQTLSMPTFILRELLASTATTGGVRSRHCVTECIKQRTGFLKAAWYFEVPRSTKIFYRRELLQCSRVCLLLSLY